MNQNKTFCVKRPTVCVTRWWAGRDNAILPESASSRVKCLKTRRLPPVGCTLCWAGVIEVLLLCFYRSSKKLEGRKTREGIRSLLFPLKFDLLLEPRSHWQHRTKIPEHIQSG